MVVVRSLPLLAAFLTITVALAGCAESSGPADRPGEGEGIETRTETPETPPVANVASPWNQYRGDAQRTGSTDISVPTWDVLGSMPLLDQSELYPRPDPLFPLIIPAVGEQFVVYGMGLVETGTGVVGLVRDHQSNQCSFLAIDVQTFDVVRSDQETCGLGWSIQGYDWERDELLVCHDAAAGEPLLVALDQKFEPIWSINAEEFLLAEDVPFETSGFRWTCANIAREPDQPWVVPIEPLGGDGLPATGIYFSHDGRLEHPWPMGRVALVEDQQVINLRPLGIGVGEQGGVTQPYDSLLPIGSTILEGGFMLPGLYSPEYAQMDVAGSQDGPLSYWSQSGAITSGVVAAGTNFAPPARGPYHGATTTVARNNVAFDHIGNYIFKVEYGVDGQVGTYTALADDVAGTVFPTEAPVVSGSKVHFGRGSQLLRYDTQSETVETFELSTSVGDWIADAQFILAVDLDTVILYDLQSLTEVKRLDVSASVVGGSAPSQSPAYRAGGGSEGGFSPMAGLNEIWVWDGDGRITRLGEAAVDDQPSFSVSALTPKVGERVEVQTTPPNGDVRDLIISWGDGSKNAIDSEGRASYEYAEAGIYTISIMAIFDDGRTATGQSTINVGGTPSVQESWVATQFRDNPDASWGVLGLTVTAIGALVAFVSIRAKRARLRRELEHIERAAKAANENAADLAAAMRERRAHVRGLVLDGRIDEGQLRVLEARIDELARDHRMGALGDKFDFLPHGFVKRLEGMLADGRISSWEEKALADLLSGDSSLTAGQKTAVRRTLRSWAAEDA